MTDSTTNGAASEPGGYRTFSGAGFGTLVVRPSSGPKPTPRVASSRAYLRHGLPAVYEDGDFGMRFIGALETVLDPIVAVLDALPAHFDPDHAPGDVLELLAAWMGISLDETQLVEHRRDIVRRAADLSRWRGTARGLSLALALAFPEVPLRVEDRGGVRWSAEEASSPVPPPSFVVYCDEPVAEEVQAAIARCIDQYKPVGTAYRLRVKAARAKDPT